MSELDQPPSHQSVAPQSVHARVIQDRQPSWYDAAALKRKKAFSQTQFEMPPWYAALSPDRQSALSAAYARSFNSLNRLDVIFNGLQGVVTFAEPLLVAAMKTKFAADYDVKRLFFAREAFMPADRSKVGGLEASGYCYYQGESLLEAALGNFALEDTIETDDQNASLVTRYDFHQQPPGSPFNQSQVLSRKVTIAPHAFASLCRELDLGAQYLAHVESFISPLDPPRTPRGSRARAVRNLMVSATRHQLQFAAEVAVARGDIQPDAYQLIQQLMSNQQDLEWRDKTVTFSSLNVLGQSLKQIIVIGHVSIHYPVRGNVVFLSEPCLAFIPGDPVCMLKEYANLEALKFDLVERLCVASYRQFFSQFIPYERQGAFFSRLKQHLDPAEQSTESQDFDSSKKNIRTLTASYGTRYALLWQDHTRQKIDLMRSNARAMAVSTDAADARGRNAWLVKLGSTALNVLNAAVLVFPELAPVMLVIGAAQMLQEVASGIEAWEAGDKQAVWAHVSAVAFNAATAVVGARLLPLVKSAFVESLAHVRCPDGNIRLHAPDLRPYQQSVSMPAQLTVNGDGLIEHEGGLYLREDNAYYRVEQVGAGNDYKILHPHDPAAFTPRVSRTRAGAWAHEHEIPLTLTEAQLMRRLGPMAEGFSDQPLKLKRIMQMSGIEVDALRRMHVHQAALPGLLADTLKRFEIDRLVAEEGSSVRPALRAADQLERFTQRYAAAERAESAAAWPIRRLFPSLPKAIVEELLDETSAAEMQVLTEQDRVPLRLAEEARHYQQQVRLARAYEGLYRNTLGNDDTQRLVLHSLDKLPGWPSGLRIDVIERLPAGDRLLDSLGPEDAAIKRRLIKFGPRNLYEVQDAKLAVFNTQADIYGAVQSAVPTEDWTAMKLTELDGGASLKQALEQMPLMPCEQLRRLLRMQPIKPGYKPPMRLAEGRIGYPLSPVGIRSAPCEQAASALYPSQSIEEVEWTLKLQDASDDVFLARMDQLEEEFTQLKATLDAWHDEDTTYRRSRGRVVNTLKNAWQRSPPHLPMSPEQMRSELREEEGGLYVVRLADEQVGDLPPITANMSHVECLDLARMSLSDASLPFLQSFSGLRWLDISHSNLTRLPEFVDGGAQITWLDLSSNDIRLTAPSRERLQNMQGLKTLKLSHNRQLGWSADLSNLRDLQRLYLENTGTRVFPAGVEVPGNLAWIDLRTNGITTLPGYAIQHPDRVNLQGNPVAPL